MGQCLSAQDEAGAEFSNSPGAYKIFVKLSTGLNVPVWVQPGDSMSVIDKKVVAIHGKQPQVVIKHTLVDPRICEKSEGKWNPIEWDATIEDIAQTQLKYSDITDILPLVKNLTHVHWAASKISVI